MSRNGRSFADLGAVFPQGASIMAKRELLYTPLLGQYMLLSKAVFVNRAKREDAVKVFAKVASEMKRRAVRSGRDPPRVLTGKG